MTVRELCNLLAALPEEWDECPVYLGESPQLEPARALIVVPAAGNDPVGPRIELRSALVYRPWGTVVEQPDRAGGELSDV